jgi:hypothetical protein
MYRRGMFHLCGLAAGALMALMSGAIAQVQQESAKDLIGGTWTLLIADNLTSEGARSPGFGPLPDGIAKFGADGKYSVEIKPSASGHEALKHSGSYALDNAGKTLSLKIEESSLPTWRGTTQSGTIEFANGDHLGWTTSVPFVASADFKGAEMIWARAK